jgi:hypothetical protein
LIYDVSNNVDDVNIGDDDDSVDYHDDDDLTDDYDGDQDHHTANKSETY